MKRVRSVWVSLAAVVVFGLLTAPSIGSAGPMTPEQVATEVAGLKWQKGPTEGRIAETAIVNIPGGLVFLDGAGTRRFLELSGNPPRDNRYTLAPDDLTWFAVFFFDRSGYVRDDEKLDADALLKSLKDGDAQANEERGRLGMPSLYTVGWHVAPHYDVQTKRLEWGVRLGTEGGGAIVNYTVRLLGRRGVMHAVLVSDPEALDRDMRAFKGALSGFEFVSGERYSEFRAGDHVAAYGLGALVVGGAAAAAVKTGAGKAIGKFLVLVGGAVAAAVGAIAKRFRRSSKTEPPQ